MHQFKQSQASFKMRLRKQGKLSNELTFQAAQNKSVRTQSFQKTKVVFHDIWAGRPGAFGGGEENSEIFEKTW